MTDQTKRSSISGTYQSNRVAIRAWQRCREGYVDGLGYRVRLLRESWGERRRTLDEVSALRLPGLSRTQQSAVEIYGQNLGPDALTSYAHLYEIPEAYLETFLAGRVEIEDLIAMVEERAARD